MMDEYEFETRLKALEHNTNVIDDHIEELEKRIKQLEGGKTFAPQHPTLPGWYGPETLPARGTDDEDYSVSVLAIWFGNNCVKRLDEVCYSHLLKKWLPDTPPDAWCYIPVSKPQTEPGEHKETPEGAYSK